jgi:hypothetical protein
MLIPFCGLKWKRRAIAGPDILFVVGDFQK